MKTLTNNLQGLQNFRRFIALGTPASSISCVENRPGRVVKPVRTIRTIYYALFKCPVTGRDMLHNETERA